MTIWVETTEVKSYETDSFNRWKPSAFFQAMEEAATHHASSFGFSYDRMVEQKMIWILSRVRIQIDRYPRVSDRVSIQTWSRGVQQKLFFGRDFIFNNDAGQPLAMASSLWVLFNPETRRFVMPQALQAGFPSHADQSVFTAPLDKIPIPEKQASYQTMVAGYSSVDMMGHVNNAAYIDWICDCFQQALFKGDFIDQLQINYLNEIMPGESTILAISQTDHLKDTWVVQGVNSATQVKAFEAQIHLGK